MQKPLFLDEAKIAEILDMPSALEAVEEAFRQHGLGKTKMPPKVYLDLPEHSGDFRAMPAYCSGYVSLKWVSVYPNNPKRGIPTVLATLLLCDPSTGSILAVMDAGVITAYRTGAAGGVAAKYLARRDSKTLGLIGTGVQARYQLLAIAELFDLDEVKIYDISTGAQKRFKAEFPEYNITFCELPEAANVDILATCTPVRKPVVRAEWIKPGTHINAIGADAPGKQELDPSLLRRSKIIVDSVEQACHSGEINVPLSKGLIKEKDLYSTLGQVVAGVKKGRGSEHEITLFDSTGLAIQDVAVAKLVYEKVSGK